MGKRIDMRRQSGARRHLGGPRVTPLGTWRFVAVSVVLLGLLGCSSTGQRRTQSAEAARPESAVATAQVRMPAEIQSLELSAASGSESVELVADRPLVWTSFRDAAGDLVIELPNSVPASAVRSLQSRGGLIAGVDIERIDDAARPLTRLVVRTREPSEHSLAGDGDMLRIQLAKVGAAPDPARMTPPSPPVTLAFEPVPEEDLMAATPEPVAAPSFGTPEAPVQGPPPTGVAASQLFSVDVVSLGEPTVVRIGGDGEFAYSMFRLENPERFVVDLTGVVNTAGSSTLPVASDQVDQIRIGQFKPRPDPVSRVVFDLHHPVAPKIERTPDGLVVSFGLGQNGESSSPVATTELAEASSASEPVESMGRDEPDGSGEPVGMEQPGTAVADVDESDSILEPETLTFESDSPGAVASEPALVAVAEPAMAEPMIEVEDVEEPVIAQFEPPSEVGSEPTSAMVGTDPPAINLEPSVPPTPVYTPPARPASSISQPVGTSDVALFEAQQVQVNQDPRLEEKEKFLSSFGTLVIDKQEKEYYGELIDMSLRKADLVETLRSFATISDLNFVIQPGVGGSVTVELKGVPWDQAMWQILKINNLGMDIDGTIVRIAPTTQLRAEAEEERRLRQVQQQSVPLRTVLKSLSYSNAAEVAALLRNRTGSILSSRGTVQVDSRTNTLILRELPGTIDTVLAVIDNLDSPEPQVTIEARIIEATKTFSRSLGIEWGFEGVANNQFGNTTGLQFPNQGTIDGGVGLLTGGSNGFLNLTLGNILNTFNLDVALSVAESEGLVNLVSAPRVTTLNNNAAQIQSGVQIPIQTVSNRTVSVQFVNATLQLAVTPQVTAEGTVMMDIQVAKRSPQPGLAVVGATNSPISTREASTKVIVRDGGTAVIGGIYEVSANQSQDRLPGLANIPILGHLFKNRNRTDQNDELMIFITPRIVQM